MSDAPVEKLASSSQQPTKKPEQTPEAAAGESAPASSSKSSGSDKSKPVGSSAAGQPQPPVEEEDRHVRARTATLGSSTGDLGRPASEPGSSKDAGPSDCPSPPIEMAEVETQRHPARARKNVRVAAVAPPPESQQGSDATREYPSTSRQGYGTFREPAPNEPGTSASASTSSLRTVGEVEILVPAIPSHNPDLSNWMVFTNLMKASMGTGILAMPMAIRNAGYAVGMPLFIAIAAVCVYCIHLLVHSSRTLRKRLRVPTLEYADTASAAFQTSRSPCMQRIAPYARGFTEVFLAVYMIGTCSVYVLFVKENLKQLIDVSCQGNEWSSLDYLMHLAVALVVLVAIPNLSSLSIVSFIANVTMVVGVLMCVGLICNEINVDQQAAQLVYNRAMDTWANVSVYNVTVEPWAGWERMPLFFGTAVFALEGIGVVLTLENRMKDRDNFLNGCGVLHIAMSIITFLYSLMGLLGYLAYGETTKGSITLNLPPDSTLAFWVRKTVTLAVFLTYPLQFYIPEEILWQWLTAGIRQVRRAAWAEPDSEVPRFIFKILLMLATVCLPLAVPRLGPAIALVGAVCLSMLGLILPTVIHAITHWEQMYGNIRQWKVWSRLVLHVIIVIVGVIGLVTGTYVSLSELGEEPATVTVVAD